VLRQLIDEVKAQLGPEFKRKNNDVAKEIKAVKEEWLKEWLPKLTSNEIPINPYRVVWDMVKALDSRKQLSLTTPVARGINFCRSGNLLCPPVISVGENRLR